MPKYIATIDDEPPQTRDFADEAAAAAWARKHAAGRAWIVGEITAGGPPRIVTSGLPADLND